MKDDFVGKALRVTREEWKHIRADTIYVGPTEESERRLMKAAIRATIEGLMEPLRCSVTRNPCGTDTVLVGQDCRCKSCVHWDALAQALKEIDDESS